MIAHFDPMRNQSPVTSMIPTRKAVREFAQKPTRITKGEAARARQSAGIYEKAASIAQTARAKGWIR